MDVYLQEAVMHLQCMISEGYPKMGICYKKGIISTNQNKTVPW